MASRTWLINSRGIARKVKKTTKLSEHELKEWGANANKECPNCHHIIDNSDVTCEWPGLPAGVKFDPSDIELLEHLSGKIELSKPHIFIDEFIPTIEANEGICYTHPENLPGVKKDGSSVHFFHKTSNAYTCGHRKRRKIHGSHSLVEENVRWHKTGKTRLVIENGVQKGCKKIMVLYKSTKKGSKPKKSNWVMHQYHLGCEDDEKEGEFVVSKVFYQQQLKLVSEKSDDNIPDHDEEDAVSLRWSPKTPKTDTPQPPSRGKHRYDELDEEIKQEYSPGKDIGVIPKTPAASFCDADVKEEKVEPTWWAGESQAVDDEPSANNINDPLLCHEILDSNACQGELGLDHFPFFSEFGGSESAKLERAAHQVGGLSDLDNLELGTPPDFQLSDLQFGSQDSIFGWLDRL